MTFKELSEEEIRILTLDREMDKEFDTKRANRILLYQRENQIALAEEHF